ncbi:MAG: outer membrane protein assembly factor BamD [Bdellovibrionales bacterium]
MQAFLKSFLLLILVLAIGACSSSDLRDSNSAEGAFRAAEEFEKDERFEEALTKYKEVQNKHPYSRFAVEAKIRIANIQYEKESFAEAQAAYQLVKDLHPKHEKIDFVTFRLGMSYFNQLPSTIDRDLTLSQKAILYFDEVIRSYPKSTYVQEAQQKRGEALRMMAEKEQYIANFYFKRDLFDSALKRYEKLLTSYPNSSVEKEALYGAAMSAIKTGEFDKGREYANRLDKQFAGSSEASNVRGELNKNGVR